MFGFGQQGRCCRIAVEGCELQVRVLRVPRFGLVDAGPFVASPMVAGFAAAGLWGHRLCVGARSWQFVIGSAMSAGCSSFPAVFSWSQLCVFSRPVARLARRLCRRAYVHFGQGTTARLP